MINSANMVNDGLTSGCVNNGQPAWSYNQGVILDALAQVDGMALVTADHGNAEEMISLNPRTGKREINTRHSLNPVPLYLFDPQYQGEYRLRECTEEHPLTLANLAATCFVLLGRTPPEDIEAPLFELG